MNVMNVKKKTAFLVVVSVMATVTGCVLPPPTPPVAEKFVFTPPSSVSATHSKMAIAILRPIPGGSFFVSDTTIFFKQSKISINRMLEAMQTDIEKILIARGFTTAGSYPAIDEMTYSQKERASLILRPTLTVDLVVSEADNLLLPQTATVSGNVVLEFLEPMSREKVWLKRLELAPITKNVKFDLGEIKTPYGVRFVHVISTNSVTDLLNTFYTPTMEKIWNQLDTREIQNLKGDADKLKGKTQYRGG